jgi:RNAse (barnase) inhibitor barstar
MSRPTVQQLDELPSHCVRPLGTLAPTLLRQWADQAQQRYVEVDCGGLRERKAVLAAIGRALGFPDWYGANLDALFDCLTDLAAAEGAAGWVIVLLRLPSNAHFDVEQRAALLDVFRDAADAFADEGVALRVFYAS